MFDQLFAIFGGLVLHVVLDVDIFEFGAQAFVLPDDPALLDQVDEADEVAFRADRQIERRRHRAETINDRLDALIEIGAGAVEPVAVAHPRNAVFLGLTPHRLPWRLDARHAVRRPPTTTEDP